MMKKHVTMALLTTVIILTVANLAGCAVTGGTELPPDQRITSLFIAPDGDDANEGNEEAPLRSLEAARDKIRALKSSSGLPLGGITVYIREGDYPINSTFSLRAQDAGTEESPIVYRAYYGERVRFYGGVHLNWDAFQPVTDSAILDRIISSTARQHLLEIDLFAQGIADLGVLSRRGFHTHNFGILPQVELYVSGERMTLARWPNDGYVNWNQVIDPGPLPNDPDYRERGGTFSYTFTRPNLWQDSDDIWVDGIFSRDWAWSYNKIANLDRNNKRITLQYGEEYGLTSWVQDFFFFENILEEIDMPGEYYIDRDTGMLYLYPPTSWSEGVNVTLSQLDVPMVTLNAAHFTTFSDIIFDTGRNSAINASDVEGVSFSGLVVRNFARNAISITGHNNTIEDSYIYDIGATAVSMRGGDWETMTFSNNTLRNSRIHDTGYLDRVYRPAVTINGVGQQIIGNMIHDTPHMGVEVRGTAHTIAYNEFYRTSHMFRDMGAIYFNLGHAPHNRGTVIRRNFFHNIGMEGGTMRIGIYMDSSSMGITVEENIFYRFGSGNHAIFNHGGAHNPTTNNMFIDCASPYRISFFLTLSWGQSWLQRFETAWDELFSTYDFATMPIGEAYPELLTFFDEDRIIPDTNIYAQNLIYNPTIARDYSGTRSINAGPEDILIEYDNWIAATDPGIVDIAGMDFSLWPDAAVFTQIPGFSEIPFDEIGPDPFVRARFGW